VVQQAHDIVSPVRHVLAHKESHVVGLELLVPDDVGVEHVTSPSCVNHVAEHVVDTCVHGDGHTSGVLKREQVSSAGLVVVEEALVVVSVHLEAGLSLVLSVVQNIFQ